jgi:hypothetical protein
MTPTPQNDALRQHPDLIAIARQLEYALVPLILGCTDRPTFRKTIEDAFIQAARQPAPEPPAPALTLIAPELQQAIRDVLQEATSIIDAVYQELGSTEEVSAKTYARIERWRNGINAVRAAAPEPTQEKPR